MQRKPDVTTRAMRRADLPAALKLWKKTEGMALTEDDSVSKLAAFLRHNPGFSSAAVVGKRLVGCVLCGCDLRRGFLYHLAVVSACRGSGIGRKLVARSIERLEAAGVTRCNILVLRDNPKGMAFWRREGWILRNDVWTMQLRFGREAEK